MAATNDGGVDDETLYVALGKNIEEGKSTLVWALQNLEASDVCILHVHRPVTCDKIFSVAELEENDISAIREIETKIMRKIMDSYREICCTAGVSATVIHTVKDNVGEGIVEFVYQHSIKHLVMGAASDKNYSQGMTDVKSRKAKYTRQHAPVSCRFWFVCQGRLIQTGNGDVEQDIDTGHQHENEANALYREERQLRQEAEEALGKEKEEHTKTKRERDNLLVERDNALKLTDELLGKQAEGASTSLSASTPPHRFYCEFSVQDIQEATHNFDPSLKISEGEYGSIYRGLLHYTPVVIQLLHQRPRENLVEFQQKVEVLSKLRHPNLVTFMGACSELSALVFEYLPGGNLMDRLSCKDDSPPLSWKTRIRIATELCSALVFISCTNPHGIPHSCLDAQAILLDENFSCRINYFDIHHCDEEEASPESDIHPFGVILLQLLTGRSSSSDIVEELQAAIEEESLEALLDSSAGEWPFLQATQLAHLGLRCCDPGGSGLPDLSSEVRSILEPMKASCGASTLTLFHDGIEERRQPPPYFICPILQEVMKDPQVAADGFTYEAEAIKSWLESGHDSSPMTNAVLQHSDLVPNHSLRSAIQEWLQQP
ncbi:PREDICTED: U-box domain-containing protein 33-like [Tarenaya hassleriana]|uniref:U-box domain-containing protein 33-like n=1 Tax=Tarenaya hassleriana TaxID=28532 RepID=UPI00053C9016|nr:PREDICTED: U-box domain-containing protein 33-like [Tarenaya hassleriana]